MTLHVDERTYRQYRDEVVALANGVTRVEDGEAVAELRTSEELAELIDGLTPAQVADIRTIAEIEAASLEDFHVADEALE